MTVELTREEIASLAWAAVNAPVLSVMPKALYSALTKLQGVLADSE